MCKHPNSVLLQHVWKEQVVFTCVISLYGRCFVPTVWTGSLAVNYHLTVGSYSIMGQVNYITVSRHSMAHHGRKQEVAPDRNKELEGLHWKATNTCVVVNVKEKKDISYNDMCLRERFWLVKAAWGWNHDTEYWVRINAAKSQISSECGSTVARTWHDPSLIHDEVQSGHVLSSHLKRSSIYCRIYCSSFHYTVSDLTYCSWSETALWIESEQFQPSCHWQGRPLQVEISWSHLFTSL